MKQFLAPVVVVLFAVAGGVGGNLLKSGGVESGEAHASASDDGGHGKPESDSHASSDDGHKPKKKKASGHGGDDGHGEGGNSSDTAFYKFSREFVVPIMADRRVKALVILHLSLEVDEATNSELFSLDPKLRDNIMTTLIGLSNDGKTLDELTSADSYETIRSMVLMNLQSGVSENIQNVLIMDVGKQDL